ncbi:hypothetical protein [Sphingomonas jeddahensis]|uniref:Uncharacterized protein n=1 Tax=Sphingomonas jeddahensis TaxID=1915074 RepID=A0A1V2EXD5_9SPHN|nr:hypothetical protein [Sphingomonas jeddahensis]ONF97193.1 hypothetical protein SPHI_06300 [Sphingomonas jeddahensis]
MAGRLAAPLLILVSAACSQAAPANQHQLQARLSSIPGKCGEERARLKATSATQVTVELPGDMPREVSQQVSACIAAEVKKISGASLSPIGAAAGAADQGPRET